MPAASVPFVNRMDVLIISLNPQQSVYELTTLFPCSSVQVQRGVDLRNVQLLSLYKSKMIGQSGYTTIKEGRKWHWELNSKGAVGLAQANRIALEKGSQPLLLLEDDYKIVKEVAFLNEVDLLNKHLDAFDLAIFGAQFQGDPKNLKPVTFMPSGWYHLTQDKFWFLHCVFYSPSGRRKVGKWLGQEPLEMQIDSLYAFWSETKDLRILLQIDHASVVQKVHISHIQTDRCALCDVRPSSGVPGEHTRNIMLVGVLLLFLLVTCRHMVS